MNILQKSLGVIALVVLAAQTVRHSYLLWLEPRGSVLDAYDQPLRDQVASARSLDELVALYEPVRKQVDEAKKQAVSGRDDKAYLTEFYEQEPFKSEASLRQAIQDWEAKAKELRSLRFYWSVGFCLLLVGAALFRFANQWLGIALEILAFSEFIYWTSPSYFGGPGREFDRLLSGKLTLSLLSLALLLALIWFQGVFANVSRTKQTPAAA